MPEKNNNLHLKEKYKKGKQRKWHSSPGPYDKLSKPLPPNLVGTFTFEKDVRQ